MARTGRPRGRPPGAKNVRTAEREAAMAEAAAALAASISDAFEGDAHALLVALYKDPARPIELRLDAAKAAIRYEKPALATESRQLLGADGKPVDPAQRVVYLLKVD